MGSSTLCYHSKITRLTRQSTSFRKWTLQLGAEAETKELFKGARPCWARKIGLAGITPLLSNPSDFLTNHRWRLRADQIAPIVHHLSGKLNMEALLIWSAHRPRSYDQTWLFDLLWRWRADMGHKYWAHLSHLQKRGWAHGGARCVLLIEISFVNIR